MTALTLTGLRFAPASEADVSEGLLGWVGMDLNGEVRLDGIAVRRTMSGELALSFPARRDSHGKDHPYLRPLTDDARRDLEAKVFEALEGNLW